MKKFHLICLFLVLSGGLAAQQGRQAALLDSLFTALYDQHQFNGSVLIAEKGAVVFKKGYGYSNEVTKSLNNPQTVFELASCSKQFTAAAIVLLKRQGKLNYSDRLSQYIPELSFWGTVTINDLLRHTSGLPDYILDMPETWDKTRIATNEDLIGFYAERRDTLQFVPGSRHEYNNTNYALLASIIERVSGESYAAFLSRHVFRPLRMKNTFVYSRRQHERKLKNYATGYVWARGSFDKVTAEDPRYGDENVRLLDGIAGSAKVHSTVDDLYKWVLALRQNKLLTKTEFEEMTRVTATSAGEQIPYGYGLDLSRGENKFAFGHTGSWDGYATLIYHDSVNDRTLLILQNFDKGTYSFENILQVLKGQPLTTEFRGKIPLPENELKKYTGTYVSEEDENDVQLITYLDGHLVHNSVAIPWDLRFFPVAADEFQGILQGGADAVLKFALGADGRMQLEMLQYGSLIGTYVKMP
jgi:CubicO group peptidase (beta-lactamase class C family)